MGPSSPFFGVSLGNERSDPTAELNDEVPPTLVPTCVDVPRSNEMSQKGSMVVETPLRERERSFDEKTVVGNFQMIIISLQGTYLHD